MQIGTDRPDCELTMSCEYDDPDNRWGAGTDDDGGDDNGNEPANDFVSCTPTAAPGTDVGYRMTITGHPTAEYNGIYCGQGGESWNGQAPYISAGGQAFYYHATAHAAYCWQFTEVLDSEIHDEYEGGRVCYS